MRVVAAYDLIDSYDVFLLDAYGVLVQSSGPLPGAVEFIAELRRRGKKIRIVSNDASKTPETCAAVYAKRGFDFSVAEFITAGLTLVPALSNHTKPKCAVLGTPDSHELVRRAGGVPTAITADARFDAVVVCDDSGFDFLPTMNSLLSSLHRSFSQGHRPRLLLANPDLLYPMANQTFGFTSGTLAKMLELGLHALHPKETIEFEPLGKPARGIFDLALKSTGTSASSAIMFGDQIHTDVSGAKTAGIASALITTGITQWPLADDVSPRPDYVIRSLEQ